MVEDSGFALLPGAPERSWQKLNEMLIHGVEAFLDHAETEGSVAERDLAALAQAHELDKDELVELRADLEARGVEITADEEEDDEAAEGSKRRYKFPCGDFKNVHRCAVLARRVTR